jgi:hypothetical protein
MREIGGPCDSEQCQRLAVVEYDVTLAGSGAPCKLKLCDVHKAEAEAAPMGKVDLGIVMLDLYEQMAHLHVEDGRLIRRGINE